MEINHWGTTQLDCRVVYLSARIGDEFLEKDENFDNLDVWGHASPTEAAHFRFWGNTEGGKPYVGFVAPKRQVVFERLIFRAIGVAKNRAYWLLDTIEDERELIFSEDFISRFLTVLNAPGESVQFESVRAAFTYKTEDQGLVFSYQVYNPDFPYAQHQRTDWVHEPDVRFNEKHWSWELVDSDSSLVKGK